jgi:antitoxin component of MazEF toxin-antitoxin module
MPVMLKTITKVGNSHGLIFDATLRELTGLKPGDQVNVTVHEGGTIMLTPVRNGPSAEEVSDSVRRTVKDYRKTLRKLA